MNYTEPPNLDRRPVDPLCVQPSVGLVGIAPEDSLDLIGDDKNADEMVSE